MPKISPPTLEWARENARLTLVEAADALSIKPDTLSAYESGKMDPSRSALMRMSGKYHQPLTVFYMKKPPVKSSYGDDFRTLDNTRPESEHILDVLLRQVRAGQEILKSALIDEEEDISVAFVGSYKTGGGAARLVGRIRESLGVSLKDFRKQPDKSAAFNLLRKAVEDKGVFVLLMGDLGSRHSKISVDVFRGYALADEIAPFIVINDNDAKAAWSFTLLHELAHLYLGMTGISASYEDSRNEIESFCNEVAGGYLLPVDDLKTIDTSSGILKLQSHIITFADKRNISSTMTAYRLYQSGLIDFATWNGLRNYFKDPWLASKASTRLKQSGGGSYYTTRRHRIGARLINLVNRLVASGAIPITKAGIVLGVNPGNIQHLADEPG